MLRVISCVAVCSLAGSAGGSTRLTTMTTSAQRWRATSTGMLRTMPPSERICLPTMTGANAPGMAMLARIAVAMSPLSSTTIWPLTMSVATAR